MKKLFFCYLFLFTSSLVPAAENDCSDFAITDITQEQYELMMAPTTHTIPGQERGLTENGDVVSNFSEIPYDYTMDLLPPESTWKCVGRNNKYSFGSDTGLDYEWLGNYPDVEFPRESSPLDLGRFNEVIITQDKVLLPLPNGNFLESSLLVTSPTEYIYLYMTNHKGERIRIRMPAKPESKQ